MARGKRAGAGAAGAASLGAGDDPAGLSNQYLGHADLLSAQIGSAREARPQVRGIRRALRQSHHAADGGAAGGLGHLCRAVLHHRPRQGGLVVIAQIEQVGRTAQVVTRKDLNLTQVSELKGRKVANQTGSSVGNIFTDVIAPAAGLKKGDFQEVRMDVNNMVAAMAAKTVDAMVNVEPYNEIAVAEGIGTSIMDYSSVDRMPVFMAATPDFVDKNPDTVVAYLKCWQEAARDFKDNPGKVADVIYAFFTSKGYAISRETFAKALAKVEVDPGFPSDLVPGLQKDAEVLLREKKISAIPDWNKALRPELWAKARG